MDKDWTPRARDRRFETHRREPKKSRRLVRKFGSPCPKEHDSLVRGSKFFRPIWVGLIRLLRFFGFDTDEAPYRSALKVHEVEIVRRKTGCAVWWYGEDGWWMVGLNPHNHLASAILGLPEIAFETTA